MIPKTIHYTWFSNEPFPQEIQNCISSWEKFMPDYEFVLWDSEKVKHLDSQFLQQALDEKKWAFASDFVRLYAIYHFGGIYLDTDVLVYKNFDELLNNKCFIGRENSYHLIGRVLCSFLSSHCFGAEKENLFIKDCLAYYEKRSFILSENKNLPNELRLDMKLLPYIQAVIAKKYGWNWSFKENQLYKTQNITILPSHYFDPQKTLKESFCKHLALGSWRESKITQDKITLKYKIEWRVRKSIEKILARFSYIIIKVK